MAEYFDPALEGGEGKVRPGDGYETIDEKEDEPSVIPNNLAKIDLPLVQHPQARQNQSEINQGIERVAFVRSAKGDGKMQDAKPLSRRPGTDKNHPNKGKPERAGDIWPLP